MLTKFKKMSTFLPKVAKDKEYLRWISGPKFQGKNVDTFAVT